MNNPGNEPATRPPGNLFETIATNLRPQPAIPGLLVLFVTVAIPVLTQGPVPEAADSGSWLSLLIPLGIIASCGLAIAAGCCSFFPQISWIAVAFWAMDFAGNGVMPAYNRWVLVAGMVAACISIVVQVWRVMTGRFVPTIRIEDPEEDY